MYNFSRVVMLWHHKGESKVIERHKREDRIREQFRGGLKLF